MSNSAGPKITKDGLVLDFDAANIKSYNFYSDPYASSVSLHLKMDGANNSTTFTDSSPNALAVTAVGDAKISTAQSRYGGSAAYFDGTGDYLNIVSSSYFNLPANFTVECWFNPSNGTNSQQVIAGKWTGTGNVAWTVVINPGLSQILLGTANSGNFVATLTFTATSTITTNTWHHLAVVRSGSTVLVFVNGVQAGAGQTSTSNLTASDSNALTIGQFQGINYFTGYIDELKITKGVARYTSAFTSPPIPSTCTDLTRSKNIGTLTGGVDYNFSNGGSLAFATSYISSPSANAYQLGANDFTFESWIYLNAYPLNNNGYYTSMIMCKDQLGSRGFNFSIIGSSSANTTLLFGGFSSNSVAQSVSPSYPFQLNTWYHVAASRIGNLLYLYVNGNLLNAGGTSFTTTIQSTTSEVRIGAQVYSGGYNYYVNGRIAIMKLYNGRGLTSTEVYNNFVANRGRFGV